MKRKFINIFLSFIGIWVAYYTYNNYFTQDNIVGTYINKNYDYVPTIVEIPYVPDTLTLFKNNQFASRFWGKGSYNITSSINGTKIELVYSYEFGKAGYQTFIKRLGFGKPKIILNGDRNHFYEKIN